MKFTGWKDLSPGPDQVCRSPGFRAGGPNRLGHHAGGEQKLCVEEGLPRAGTAGKAAPAVGGQPPTSSGDGRPVCRRPQTACK